MDADNEPREALTPGDQPPSTPFEAIRHEDAAGGEYWTARELARILGYTDYRNFLRVVDKARLACANSGHAPVDHFVDVTDMIQVGKGARRKVADVQLSRYACYLIVQNADPEKPIVALGQTYFAVQTRRQELADAEQDLLAGMTEDQRRLFVRRQLAGHNRELAVAARGAGVITGQDFAIFQDHGYMGLYGGLRASDIHARKGLHPNQEILDHMGSTELAANLFRATQTEERLRREGVQGKEAANLAHHQMGRAVRQFIAAQNGTMPEDLPTPTESIQQLQQVERRRLQQEQARRAQFEAGQQSLFGDGETSGSP